MKCSRCRNFIKSTFQCNICKQKLCSEDCLISHSSEYHKSNASSPIIPYSFKKSNSFTINIHESKKNNDQSPFLVKGIFNNKKIIYDNFYSLENFTLININGEPKLIGNGSFGQVYLAENNLNKKVYAIKHMEKEELIKYLNDLDQIYREIDIQSRVDHPNIIRLLYVKETDETFDLVMEYAKYGTLFDFVVKRRGIHEDLVFKFFIQIVNAIKLLHENNIIHRDIKPENILLFDDYIVKLCDFGWCIKCDSKLPRGSFTGTSEYLAPEIINEEDYGKEIDIWMLGILLYEMIHGFSPFRPKKQNFEEKELIENIRKHEILFYMPCSDEYKELVFALLEPDVKKRFTIDDIYESKFVKKYENKESQINNEEYSKYSEEEKEKFENTSDNNNNRSFEKIEENNIYEIKKNLLANRYENSEELDDSKQILSKQKDNPEIILDNLNNSKINDVSKKVTKKESDRLTNSKFSNFDFKENNSNTNATEEQYEEKRSSPKNNNRNRKKKIKNNNIKVFEVNSDVNNSTKNEIKAKNDLLDNSPKNSNKNKKINKKNNLNLILPNNFKNNNKDKKRNFMNQENDKIKLDKSEDNINIQNIQITNYIFQNKENKTPKDIEDYKIKNISENEAILTKKLSLNQKNQVLSLSLVPGTADYNLLLNNNESQLKVPKEKNTKVNFNNLNNGYIFLPLSDSQNNVIRNIKEFPFDHFTCNSSLDIHIQKTIFNNKMVKHRRLKNISKPEEKNEDIKEKEPNDNMRRRNKKIKNEMPLDNLKKEIKETKEIKKIKDIKPIDSHKKAGIIYKTKNILNNNKNNKEKINNNIYNPISEAITKKIVEYTKQKKNRNFSVKNSNNLRNRKKNNEEDDINNKGHLLKTANYKNKIEQNKNLKVINNKKENKKILKRYDMLNKIVKIEKINQGNLSSKQLNVKNNSFVILNSELKKYFAIRTTSNEADKDKRSKNINIERFKKTKSANKNREFQFNKDNKVELISPKNNINNIKELGKIKSIKQINKNINIKLKDIKEIKEENEKNKMTEENLAIKMNNNENKSFKFKNEGGNFTSSFFEKQADLTKIKNSKDKINPNYKNKENQQIAQDIEKNKKTNFDKENKKDLIKNNNITLEYNLTDKEYQNIFAQKKENNMNSNQQKFMQIKEEMLVKYKNEEIKFKENKENMKNDINIKDKGKKYKMIIEKEITEEKADNLKMKEVYRFKEFHGKNDNRATKNFKNENKSEKDINTNIISKSVNSNCDNNEKNQKEKGQKIENMKMKELSNRNHSSKKMIYKKKIENSELKLCLDNIYQNIEDNSCKESRTTRVNIDSIERLEKGIKFNLKLSNINKSTMNEISSSQVYPKKVGSDSNSSNSSIYEYDKPINNKEDNKIENPSDIKKINLSNSETKIQKYSKNHLTNFQKINDFSGNNYENINILNKSKSTNIKKQIAYRNLENNNEFKFKVEKTLHIKNTNKNVNKNSNKKELNKGQKVKKMHKNKTEHLLNKNRKNNKLNNNKQIKNTKKENSGLNKKINPFTNDKRKNSKKKYKKSLTESVKDENEFNEKCYESESNIIEGDSEYGDNEVF